MQNILQRSLYSRLVKWKSSKTRKPLVIKGARQVGKTSLVRQFGRSFENLVEINFEQLSEAKSLFAGNLDPKQVLSSIELLTGEKIHVGRTLLFFDEVQECSDAIIALRYFYEQAPELHVVASGSLLEFKLREISVPVGRLEYLHLYPLSFEEFISARDRSDLIEYLNSLDWLKNPISQAIHNLLLMELKRYYLIGGMPEAVNNYIEHNDLIECQKTHTQIMTGYRQDFLKYGKKHELSNIEQVFNAIPRLLTQKFKYADVDREARSRNISTALSLLVAAQVAHKVYNTAGNGVPLGAETNINYFKAIFVDVGLVQRILGLDLRNWEISIADQYVNNGPLAEHFVGQELIAHSKPDEQMQLHYWKREEPSSSAEVDYLIAQNQQVVPVEVKAGKSIRLKSMYMFLESKKHSSFGVNFSASTFSRRDKVVNLPLYMVGVFMRKDIGEFFARA